MITREEEIINAARKYVDGCTLSSPSDVLHFEAGAKWSDEHPKNDQRDWSKFKVDKHKFDPKTLNPFDKVLVHDNGDDLWRCDFFNFISNTNTTFPYVGLSESYKYCIPYNDDTKHLLGTTEEAPEYYRYWED